MHGFCGFFFLKQGITLQASHKLAMYGAEDDLELLILLSPVSEFWVCNSGLLDGS